ncbi:YihY/virulence factor BrkB family protein [Ruegeria arenilitoris]|uniref:YihY/virulence factor BrkB family protein n=1 Tax=Ruegeria arenilitoris TaxID=1173585 RepID=UPI00147E92A7|nr:YihY/virulence factor BrkB family protein [Ruegeria arenilitoris]
MNYKKNYAAVLVGAWRSFNNDYGWSRASHVAMSMILALFPFCIFALSTAGLLGAELDPETLSEFVFGSWPSEIAIPITKEIEAVLAQSSRERLTIGALMAIFFASNGVDAARIAITGAYRERDPRPIWQIRLLCISFVLSGAAILSLAGALAVGIPIYLEFISETSPKLYATFFPHDAVRVGIPFCLLVIALCAAHLWLPGVRRPLSGVLPGIVLTLLLWIVAGYLFISYFRNFGSYSLTYAGLAGVMAALVFLYIMSAIFVLGAEFNGQLDADKKNN